MGLHQDQSLSSTMSVELAMSGVSCVLSWHVLSAARYIGCWNMGVTADQPLLSGCGPISGIRDGRGSFFLHPTQPTRHTNADTSTAKPIFLHVL